MASSELFAGRVKFVKVNVDNLKSLAKAERIKVMPQVTVFRPGHGRLLSFQPVPSKLKIFKPNLTVMLDPANRKKFFKLDPNGFVTVVDADPTPEMNVAKQAAAELASSTGSLYDRLMASAASTSSSKNGTASASSTSAMSAAHATSPQPPISMSSRRGASADTVQPSTHAVRGTGASADTDTAMRDAKERFLQQWGGDYGYGGRIDELYPKEIGCRLRPGEHYLDYTGSSLYCTSALKAAFEDLQANVYGNPHSASPSSQRSTDAIEEVRDTILRFFHADAAEYQVVFTDTATGALKMVGETFPWTPDAVFRYTRENHNSVLGIREYALQHGARFQAVEEDWVEEWIAGHKEGDRFVHPAAGSAAAPSHSLFAYPAEENFAGGKYPLRWIREIQGMSTAEHRWKVLLDAAAFVPTQPLDLSQFPADFVAISFYKMFGFPTGLGALLVRTENIDLLQKGYWGGGTVAVATSSDNFHVLKCKPSDKFEDGTVAFLDIVGLKHAFAFLEGLGGVEAVQAHVHALTRHAYERLTAMKHTNGAPMALIFGRHAASSPLHHQGGIVNFEALDPAGRVFNYRDVEHEASEAGFHIRTGILCNPGAAYRDVGVTDAEVGTLAGVKEGCGDEVDFIEVQRPVGGNGNGGGGGIVSDADLRPLLETRERGSGTGDGDAAGGLAAGMKWVMKPLGSVRVSLGYMSTFEDVEAFCQFIERTYVDRMADGR